MKFLGPERIGQTEYLNEKSLDSYLIHTTAIGPMDWGCKWSAAGANAPNPL